MSSLVAYLYSGPKIVSHIRLRATLADPQVSSECRSAAKPEVLAELVIDEGVRRYCGMPVDVRNFKNSGRQTGSNLVTASMPALCSITTILLPGRSVPENVLFSVAAIFHGSVPFRNLFHQSASDIIAKCSCSRYTIEQGYGCCHSGDS
jgi:hypothetical protein